MGGGNFTRLLCALLITLISLPALATPYKNLYVHAEAYPNGAGKVFIEPKNEDDNPYVYFPKDNDPNEPAQTFDYKATIGESYGGSDNHSGDCLKDQGMYAVKFTATAAPGYKFLYLSSKLKEDGTPDETSIYKGVNVSNDKDWHDYGPEYPIINVNNPSHSQDGHSLDGPSRDDAFAKWTGSEQIDTYVYVVFEEYIFTVDGLKYQQTSETEVRVRGYEGALSSKLVIPATIDYDNKTFNVTKIEAGAFGDCSNVEEVFVNSTSVIEISENTFAKLSAGTKLYVPFGKASEYKATGENKWGRFKEIIETSFDGSVPVTVGNAFAGVVVDANSNYKKVTVTNVKNYALTDGADMVTLQNDFTAENASYSRPTMSTTWGSVCLPFALASNDDVKYFELTEVSEEALTFSPVETVAANTPVFFKRNENNYTATVANAEVKKLAGAGHPSKEAITGWTAEGVYKAETVKAATGNVSYFIYGDKFYYTEGNMDMTPFRAYFTVQKAKSPQSTLRINEDLHPTDVQEIRENADGTVTVIFDLNGRRLSEPQRGAINIVNGKKVLVK